MKVSLIWVILIYFCFSNISISSEGEVAGRVVASQGEAKVRNDLKKKGLTDLKVGDRLYKGDVVNTSSDGAVKLLMSDKTILDIGPSSLFKVNEYKLKNVNDRQVDLGMDYGKVRALVNQKVNDKGRIQIRTKAAVMGVRGTEFIVNAGSPSISAQFATGNQGADLEIPKTEIVVISGQVDVAMPQAKSLDGGALSSPPKTMSLTAGTKMTTVAAPPAESNLAGGASPQTLSATPTESEPKVEKVSETEMTQIKSESSLTPPTLAVAAVASAEKKSDSSRGPSSEGGSVKSGLSQSLLASIGEAVKSAPTYAPSASDLNFKGSESNFNQLPSADLDQRNQKEEANLGVIFSY